VDEKNKNSTYHGLLEWRPRASLVALEDAKSIGLDPALDYTQDVPKSLNRSFDIVFDTNGSLTPAQGDALTKRGGVVVTQIRPPASS
jgi:NADPH:quinone reductase-like Zn-dependent oxidoreductase